ncbi:MAG: hypothetical protein LBU70_09925 [Chitinispirillales bacterium]|jgi:hypothetical protein|nr:hypothetical protein [Chitinispirillales bacterium]
MPRVSLTLIIAVIAVAVLSVNAAPEGRTPLSDNVSGELEKGEYLVKSTITVQEGEVLNIHAGAILYFDHYAGLDVYGELLVDGQPDSPVIMTSVNDVAGSAEPPQAFDWNGIKVEGTGAAVHLRHTHVKNSVYGVNVRDPAIRAEFMEAIFENNGYASLVRGDHTVLTSTAEPFTAMWNIEPPKPDATVSALRTTRDSDDWGGNRHKLTIGAFGAAALGVIVSSVSLVRLGDNHKRYIHNTEEGNEDAAAIYRERMWGNITMGSVGAALTGIALTCIGVTFVFDF